MPHQQVTWDFHIDNYINRFIPRPRLDVLPIPISWFLGYRAKPEVRIGSLFVWVWSFIGAFLGILVIEAVFQTEGFKSKGTPMVIASFGAAAILEYNAIESPFAQPRNAIVGQLISSIIGISITKLFALSSSFSSLRFLASALAVAISSAVMGITNTVYPPAGATALLAVSLPEITKLGWFLVPLVLLGMVLMLAVACIVNNVQRQFPMYWWTAQPLSPLPSSTDDIEIQKKTSEHIARLEQEDNDPERHGHNENRSDSISTTTTSSATITEVPTAIERIDTRSMRYSMDRESRGGPEGGTRGEIIITASHITIPDWMALDAEQGAMLEIFRDQLRNGLQL